MIKVEKDLIDDLKEYIKSNYENKTPIRNRKVFRVGKTLSMEYDMVSTCNVLKPRDLEEVILNRDDSFQQYLFKYMDLHNLDEVEVYKNAFIDRKLFSKIRSNIDYRPQKKTILKLIIAMKMNIDDALDLLGKAGYSLSSSIVFDLVIKYCIEKQIYDIMMIDSILYEMNEQLLSE